ncbi:hypothetical protein SODALDRAFT_379033 [Sodiomyces alkalinus F11]|uniref:Uncharacterized protein n=1 Tax=Sodiomyces alkalinus (strain CBS 110278 / VKM F-3762 / F11) TaxID=1314773 RepID=A0A3N2PTB4_SODAK|nr:hypothetical protein SODALDRAFT_379033 [Sodiomyces alkalinus F11]ROT37759.1 hypothetical protein SODALDRAFT_379033 [Sodiomyces alkalinus F11]
MLATVSSEWLRVIRLMFGHDDDDCPRRSTSKPVPQSTDRIEAKPIPSLGQAYGCPLASASLPHAPDISLPAEWPESLKSRHGGHCNGIGTAHSRVRTSSGARPGGRGSRVHRTRPLRRRFTEQGFSSRSIAQCVHRVRSADGGLFDWALDWDHNDATTRMPRTGATLISSSSSWRGDAMPLLVATTAQPRSRCHGAADDGGLESRHVALVDLEERSNFSISVILVRRTDEDTLTRDLVGVKKFLRAGVRGAQERFERQRPQPLRTYCFSLETNKFGVASGKPSRWIYVVGGILRISRRCMQHKHWNTTTLPTRVQDRQDAFVAWFWGGSHRRPLPEYRTSDQNHGSVLLGHVVIPETAGAILRMITIPSRYPILVQLSSCLKATVHDSMQSNLRGLQAASYLSTAEAFRRTTKTTKIEIITLVRAVPVLAWRTNRTIEHSNFNVLNPLRG